MRRLFAHNRRRVGFSGIISGLALGLIVIAMQTMACPIELPTTTINIKGHTLNVELATTPASRSCGLSHRDELPDDHGMLFVFAELRTHTFWMKDTSIALSIAFLDDSGKIFSIQDMIPIQTAEQYPSGRPANYALEVNQGWFRRHGIEVGDVVKIKLPLVLNIR